MITTHGWGTGAITTGGMGSSAEEVTQEIQYVFPPEEISPTEVTYGFITDFHPQCIIVCRGDDENIPWEAIIIGS